MKNYFLLLTGISLVIFFSCNNNGGTPPGDTTRRNTEVWPKAGVNESPGRCTRAMNAERAYGQRLINRFREYLIPTKDSGYDWKNSAPIQKKLAEAYVKKYVSGCPDVLRQMGSDVQGSFSFNDTTLGAFANMFCDGRIDGMRLYLAKYTADGNDHRRAHDTYYTLVLIGTKYDSIEKIDKDVLVPMNSKAPELYISLQDYSNPCKPTPCNGSIFVPNKP